jgi:hypothetical protein
MLNRPTTKRREKRIKPGVLAGYYAKLKYDDPDVVIHNESPAGRADAHYLHSMLNTPTYNYKGEEQLSIMEELQKRGYDITTLNFSIRKINVEVDGGENQ